MSTEKVYGRCHLLQEWQDWDVSIHEQPEQIERQGRSMRYPFVLFDLDFNKKNVKFSSSSDLPYYQTTLHDCTCYDFEKRRLPCKHIYRLAVELGIVEIVKRPKAAGEKGRKTRQTEEVANILQLENIHIHPEQIARQKRGLESTCKPISIDREAQTGVFSGSGKKPYETTLGSCTCRDYFLRRLPCKHIYRLMHELGLIFDLRNEAEKGR